MKTIKSTNAFFLFVNVVFILGSAIMPILGDWGQFVFLLLLPVLYVKYYRQENLRERMQLNPISIKSLSILTLITLIGVPVTAFLLNLSVMGVGNQMDFLFKEELNKPFLVLLFSLAVVPALCEEVFLRGVILTGHKNLKWRALIFFNGILFGVFHLNVNQFSYALFLGATFALAVLITKSLAASVWMHFINNGFSAVMSKFFEDPKATATAAITWQETLILGIISIFAVAAMVYLFNYLSKSLHGISFVKYLDENDLKETEEAQHKVEVLHQRERVLQEAQLTIMDIRDEVGATGVLAPFHPHWHEEKYNKQTLLSAMTWHIYVMIALFGLFSILLVYMAQNPAGL